MLFVAMLNAVMLNAGVAMDVMLSVVFFIVMLSGVILNVGMLSVVILNAVMLRVMAPGERPSSGWERNTFSVKLQNNSQNYKTFNCGY
jgi:hypothetical protein